MSNKKEEITHLETIRNIRSEAIEATKKYLENYVGKAALKNPGLHSIFESTLKLGEGEPHARIIRKNTCIMSRSAIIMDIGNLYAKVGFAEEATPRFVCTSPFINLQKDLNYFRLSDDIREHTIRVCLIRFFNVIYQQYLLTDSRQRPVVLLQNIYSGIVGSVPYKSVLSVLFKHFKVPSISLVCTQLACLFTKSPLVYCLKTVKGEKLRNEKESIFKKVNQIFLVVDLGYLECRILPVAYATPLTSALQISSCLGGKFIDGMYKSYIKKDMGLAEFATNCLLEGHNLLNDEEYLNLPELILESVLTSPIDLRALLLSNIVLCGGNCSYPNFSQSLLTKLRETINSQENKYYRLKALAGGVSLSKNVKGAILPIFMPWTGASIYGTLNELLKKKGLSKEDFLNGTLDKEELDAVAIYY
ncbi:hypothetical protein Zmor_004327 [Zophobas morio]|jgi:actin-related protein|uniref:Actin-related protein 10 n=1 Tax=Zophobas morio TaxID=2755281 RepID=A0AA38HKH9_9CUCU|nr:hypothetical protein Zmor_004327 [Zophobas morio]